MEFRYSLKTHYVKAGAVGPHGKPVTMWLVFFLEGFPERAETVNTGRGSGNFIMKRGEDTNERINKDERLHVWLFASNPFPADRTSDYCGDVTSRLGTAILPLLSCAAGKKPTVNIVDPLGHTVGTLLIYLEQIHGGPLRLAPEAYKERNSDLQLVIDLESQKLAKGGITQLFREASNATELKTSPPFMGRVAGRSIPVWLWLKSQLAIPHNRTPELLESWANAARCFSDVEFNEHPPSFDSPEAAEYAADFLALFPRYHAYVRDRSSRGIDPKDAPPRDMDDWLPPEYHPDRRIVGADCEDAATSAMRTSHALRGLLSTGGGISKRNPWLQTLLQREKVTYTFFAVGSLKLDEGKHTWHAYCIQLDALWVLQKLGVDPQRAAEATGGTIDYKHSGNKLLPAALIECTSAEGATIGSFAKSFNELTLRNANALPLCGADPLTKGSCVDLMKGKVYPHVVSLTCPALFPLGIGTIYLTFNGKAAAPTENLMKYDNRVEMHVYKWQQPNTSKDTYLRAEAAMRSLFPDPRTLSEPTPPKKTHVAPISADVRKGLTLLNVFFRSVDVPANLHDRLAEHFKEKKRFDLVLSMREIPVSGETCSLVNVRIFRTT